MTDRGHQTPENAAMEGFPPAHCRVVASRASAGHAYVLLDTGSPGQPYLYGVSCAREHGRWVERGSSNGPGWEQTGQEPDVGILSLWDDAPNSADAVRVRYADRLIEEAVANGAYLLVWFDVPCPSEWPYATAFRIGGVWRTADPGHR